MAMAANMMTIPRYAKNQLVCFVGEHPTFAEIHRDSQDRGVELKTQL